MSSSSVGRRFVTTWSRPRSSPTSSRLSTRSAAGDPLEVEAGDPVVAHALGRVGRDGEDLEAGLGLEDPERRLAVGRRDDRLVRVRGDLAGGRAVELAVDPDDAAERRDGVGLERVPVGLDELVAEAIPTGSVCLTIATVGAVKSRAIRYARVEVEVVVERRPLAPDLGRVGEGPAAVGRLAVERGPLVGVLAVAQVVDLLEDDGEALRERVVRDLVEVGRDLGVVGGDGAERVGGELRPQLRAERVVALQLGDELRGSARGCRPRPRPAPFRAAAPRSAAPPTSIISIASSIADELGADGRARTG